MRRARRHCPRRSAAVPVALIVVAPPVMVVAVVVVVVVVVVGVAVVAVEVVVVVAGSWLRLVVVVDRMWERFGLVSGDAASAETQRYLFLQCGYQTITRGAVVKRDIIVTAGRQVFESWKKQLFFLHQIKLNWLWWSPSGVLLDYMWSPARVLRDWIRSPGKVSILMDSIRSLSGVHQDSLIVYKGCFLGEVQMDSRKTPDGLQEDS